MNQWDGSRLLDRKCEHCEKTFKTFLSHSCRYCSRECMFEHRRKAGFEKRKRICEVCGTAFVPKHPKSPGYTCSKICNGIRSRLEVVKCGKYRRVFVPDHPKATKQGYVLEHRVVAEVKIGRRLRRGEVVHHIDGNQSNNHPDNLEVLTDSQHKLVHAKERSRSTKGTFTK